MPRSSANKNMAQFSLQQIDELAEKLLASQSNCEYKVIEKRVIGDYDSGTNSRSDHALFVLLHKTKNIKIKLFPVSAPHLMNQLEIYVGDDIFSLGYCHASNSLSKFVGHYKKMAEDFMKNETEQEQQTANMENQKKIDDAFTKITEAL